MSSPADMLEALTSKAHNGYIPEQYQIDGILTFLQNEWNKMELQRIQWEVEKAEMQARIAFLQGEKTGQENLKQDLIRRIKMLEYALVQERARNHHLSVSDAARAFVGPSLLLGAVNKAGDGLPSADKLEDTDDPVAAADPLAQKSTSRQELNKIRNMLKDLGLGETVSQLRQTRVKQLFGIQQVNPTTKPTNPSTSLSRSESVRHRTEADDLKQQSKSTPKHPPASSKSISQSDDESAAMVLANFDFLSTSPATSPSKQPDWPYTTTTTGDVGKAPPAFDETTASVLFDVLVSQELSNAVEANRFSPADLMKQLDTSLVGVGVPPRALSAAGDSAGAAASQNRNEWAAVDQQVIAKLKERYKQERAGKRVSSASPSVTPSQSSDEMEDASSTASTTKELPDLDDASDDDGRLLYGYENIPNDLHANSAEHDPYALYTSKRPTSMAPKDLLPAAAAAAAASAVTVASNLLGDLASVTVANEMEEKHASEEPISFLSVDVDSGQRVKQHQWTAKYTLRSHFDGVRAVQFHAKEPLLVTASEDHTLKFWNLNKTVPAKKSTNWDVEPVHTLRCHSSPVLACQLHPTRDQEVYSADLEGKVLLSRLPSPMSQHHDPYEAYDSNTDANYLRWGSHSKPTMCHKDAVWSLAVHPHAEKMESYDSGYLLSASSDGTVCLWQPTDMEQPMRHIYQITGGQFASGETIPSNAIPTSIAYCTQRLQQFLVATTNGCLLWVDMETGQTVQQAAASPISHSVVSNDPASPSSAASRRLASSLHCYRVLSHPTLPLAITGHGDGAIRFYDQQTAKLSNCMVAHLDAVTSLAVDPTANNLQILSGSHDCSIRLWSIHNHVCVQELTSHRRKLDESIHDVAFHPEKKFLASVGADGLAKVYI